ncbi:hypothetical protein TNCV_634291 [Trichonephila clavipes]|nr:hypothetical protein TNCV_634291 [Trichonephila clavipes]
MVANRRGMVGVLLLALKGIPNADTRSPTPTPLTGEGGHFYGFLIRSHFHELVHKEHDTTQPEHQWCKSAIIGLDDHGYPVPLCSRKIKKRNSHYRAGRTNGSCSFAVWSRGEHAHKREVRCLKVRCHFEPIKSTHCRWLTGHIASGDVKK